MVVLVVAVKMDILEMALIIVQTIVYVILLVQEIVIVK